MKSLPPNIVLTEASAADLPAIAETARVAFLSDTHTQLKDLVNGGSWFTSSDAQQWLQSLLDNPRIDIIVARNQQIPPGQSPTEVYPAPIAGFSIWGKRNYDDTTNSAPAAPPGPRPPAPMHPSLPVHRPLTVRDLEFIANQSMTDWQGYFCPPSVRCRFVVSCSVRPEYQGRGIGGALLRWGIDKCDDEGVYCWVQSSMGALRAYEAVGFTEVGRLELNLDDFSEGHSIQDGKGWGIYVWPYMLRQPTILRSGDGDV